MGDLLDVTVPACPDSCLSLEPLQYLTLSKPFWKKSGRPLPWAPSKSESLSATALLNLGFLLCVSLF